MNLPPITSPAGMLLAAVVAAVMAALGGWISGGGLQRFRESRAAGVIGIAVIIALVIWKH